MNRQLDHSQFRSNRQNLDLVLICDGVQSPANIGSIFRLCDAFGVKKVYFSAAVDTSSGRFRKTARSTYGWVSYQDLADSLATVRHYKEQHYAVIALEITENSLPLQEFRTKQPLCLLIGSEIHGISQALLEETDHTVHIPLFGQNSSMNVAQATAVLLYELSKS